MTLASKYLNPKNDVAFKHIFGTEKNKDILLTMLNEVLKGQLHNPIKKIEFVQTIQEPEVAGSKQSIVDVLCEDQDGCKYVVEMQVSEKEGFEKRAEFYASRAYVNQAKKGDRYEDLKEVIFLAFTDYIIFPEKEHYKSEHITSDKKTGKRNLTSLSYTFVELPKFAKQCKKPINELTLEEKFYYFLDNASSMNPEDSEKLAGKHTIIKRAFDQLNQFYWSDEEIKTYEKQEKINWDHRASLIFAEEKGMKKGEEKGKKEYQDTIKELTKKGKMPQEYADLILQALKSKP